MVVSAPRVPARPRDARQRGFTLIETCVAVAILGLIAASIFPLAASFVDVALQQATEDELNALAAATEAFFEDTGVFPAQLLYLETKPPGISPWCGPYLLPEFVGDSAALDDYRYDAWRRPYQLLVTSGYVRTVRSFGANGVDDSGGGDDVSRVIDAAPFLRARTVAEIQRINAAIVAYNVDHLPDSLLPSSWASAITALQTAGMLPTGATAAAEYRYDAWGREYVPGSQPTISVTSLGPP